MKNTRVLNRILAVGTAAAIATTASTLAFAAPIGGGQLALKSAVSSDVVDVSWRGRRNTAIGLGILGGLALGGALAHGHYYGGYYGAPYGYYAAPPPPRRCWQQLGPYRGQGRWVYC